MPTIPTVSPQNTLGFVDKIVGLGKELVGDILDKESLIEAGEAQQTKGTERLKALRAQAKADLHRSKADAQEGRQKTAQAAKG